ncbi:cold-shock protein [Bradyrhizobium sp. USDA 4473]
MRRGTITSWRADRGFGFIRPDDGGPDIFLHFRGLAPGHRAAVGARVVFDTEYHRDAGRDRAVDATVE